MMTQSGCFGSSSDSIDNVEEVSAAVDDIMVGVAPETSSVSPIDYMLAQRCVFMEQRLRLLTWAVVAIVAYIVIKDIKLK